MDGGTVCRGLRKPARDTEICRHPGTSNNSGGRSPSPPLPASHAQRGKDWSDWSLRRARVPGLLPPCMSDSHGESQAPPEMGHHSREGVGKKYPRLSPAAFSSAVLPPPPSAKHNAAGARGCSRQGPASQGTEQDTAPWYPHGVQEATFLNAGLLGWEVEREDGPRKAEEVATRLQGMAIYLLVLGWRTQRATTNMYQPHNWQPLFSGPCGQDATW